MPEIPLNDLARGDERAWSRAYPVLYREVWIVLKARLRSGFGIDLEEVAVAIITDEVMPGLRDRRTESFRQVAAFDDVVRLAKAIAARRAIDTIRKVTRRGEQSLPEGYEKTLRATASEVDPGNEDFFLLVGKLKPPKPALFVDYFLGGLAYGEIADKHEMPLGSVCCHFKRGVDELRRLLTTASKTESTGYSHE